MFCALWYHLYNLKNMKNTHGGVLLLVKLQALACNFTKSYTPWVFFTFFKLHKWYQIAQRITYCAYLASVRLGCCPVCHGLLMVNYVMKHMQSI